MSTAVGAPGQHKQPSRKGKKAWRKNVDITSVQDGLEQVRDEEIEGGVLAEKPSDELFTIDTVGSEEVRQKQKSKKPLRSDEILAQRSAIPAVDSRKRPSSNVTDGIVQSKSKRPRSDWVTHAEWVRLKKVAKEGNTEIKGSQRAVSYDPWSDNATPSNNDESKFSFLPKQKPTVAPPTLGHSPISLAANGKPIPSVRNPDPGTSYNPSFEDWDRLLTKEGEKEVEAEKQRLEDQKAEEERLARAAEANDDNANGEAGSDDESAWEGFESGHESTKVFTKKRPERKTQAQRNKIKRRKEAERRAKWEAQMKKREEQAAQAKVIAKTVKDKDTKKKSKQDDNSSEEGDDDALRRRRFGKSHVPDKPLEVVLPDELQDSLRLLKPEGNLLGDRFRNLLVQGKLETRKPIVQPKKAKREYTEKWTYKDFKI